MSEIDREYMKILQGSNTMKKENKKPLRNQKGKLNKKRKDISNSDLGRSTQHLTRGRVIHFKT
jgi:hypothetical protein